MKKLLSILFVGVLAFASCTSNGAHSDETKASRRVKQSADTVYTSEAAMDMYATNPERALLIIDSAEIVGNLTDIRAELLRAVVYSRTYVDIQLDSAIMIGERLIQNEKVLADPNMKEEVLGLLLNACGAAYARPPRRL